MRAVNVGTGRKVPMAGLRALLEQAGATCVETYIQSGNVVFDHPERGEEKLARSLERRLEAEFGFAIPVMLRSLKEWEAVIAGNPFPNDDERRPLVAFLRKAPAAGAFDAIDRAAFEPEQFVAAGREIYLDLPLGAGRAKLPQALARASRIPDTARNWRTVLKLDELARAGGG